jgi:hypothetical protein
METAKINTRLAWIITEDNMTCTFPDGIKQVFVYTDIKDWDKSHMEPLIMGLFQHGLKQKLADVVAGATKNGIGYPEQAKAMSDKWTDIKTGVSRERKNAAGPKVTLASAFEAIDAMDIPDAIKDMLKAKISGK